MLPTSSCPNESESMPELHREIEHRRDGRVRGWRRRVCLALVGLWGLWFVLTLMAMWMDISYRTPGMDPVTVSQLSELTRVSVLWQEWSGRRVGLVALYAIGAFLLWRTHRRQRRPVRVLSTHCAVFLALCLLDFGTLCVAAWDSSAIFRAALSAAGKARAARCTLYQIDGESVTGIVIAALPGIAMLAALVAGVFRPDPRPPFEACRQCSYNLTGNVSGRCPECGEAIPTVSSTPREQEQS